MKRTGTFFLAVFCAVSMTLSLAALSSAGKSRGDTAAYEYVASPTASMDSTRELNYNASKGWEFVGTANYRDEVRFIYRRPK